MRKNDANLIESSKKRYNVKDFQELKTDPERTLFDHVQDEDLEDIAIELMLKLDKLNEDCCDNYRIFPDFMYEDFLDVEDQGCCGSYSWSFVTCNNNLYFLGFNYGH